MTRRRDAGAGSAVAGVPARFSRARSHNARAAPSEPARRLCAAASPPAACGARGAALGQASRSRRPVRRAAAAAPMAGGFETFVPPKPVPGCTSTCLVRARAAPRRAAARLAPRSLAEEAQCDAACVAAAAAATCRAPAARQRGCLPRLGGCCSCVRPRAAAEKGVLPACLGFERRDAASLRRVAERGCARRCATRRRTTPPALRSGRTPRRSGRSSSGRRLCCTSWRVALRRAARAARPLTRGHAGEAAGRGRRARPDAGGA